MKVFRNGKVFVQLKDLKYLFEYGGYIIPQSVYKKALKRTLDMTDEDKNEFIMFDDPKEVELFREIKYIIDLDQFKDMSDKEINDFLLSSKSKLEVLKAKADFTDKYFEKLRLRSKYRAEVNRLVGINDARLYNHGKLGVNVPETVTVKRKKLSIFGRRNG